MLGKDRGKVQGPPNRGLSGVLPDQTVTSIRGPHNSLTLIPIKACGLRTELLRLE